MNYMKLLLNQRESISKNIEINIQTSSNTYETLYPVTDYNILKNLPSSRYKQINYVGTEEAKFSITHNLNIAPYFCVIKIKNNIDLSQLSGMSAYFTVERQNLSFTNIITSSQISYLFIYHTNTRNDFYLGKLTAQVNFTATIVHFQAMNTYPNYQGGKQVPANGYLVLNSSSVDYSCLLFY